MKRAYLFAASTWALAVCQTAQAQTPLYTSPPPPWVNGDRKAVMVAPTEVLPDRRITFRLRAPEAQSVSVSVGTRFADLHTYPMTKNDKGVWSATIGPVDPEIYPYSFQMGGASVNQDSVQVRGSAPAIYDAQNVPAGTFTSVPYFSKVLNIRRKMHVYVPPQYYSEPNRRFPVLYYYNDLGNDAGGRQPETMDNLIANNKAVPMIVVNMSEVATTIYRKDPEAGRVKNSEELVAEVFPLIESRYRTLPGRQNRALGGVSHNAGATWTAAMMHLDKIGSIGMLSSGMFGGLLPDTRPGGYALYAPWEPEKVLPAASKKLLDPATKPKLFYIAAGDIDPRVNPTREAVKQMGTYGLRPVFEVYPGGHQGKATRPAYISFVSKLFK